MTRAELATASSDLAELDAAVSVLANIAPENPGTRYFVAIAMGSHGDVEAALATLDRARAGGLPDEAYEPLHAALLEARPVGPRLVRLGVVMAGLWIAGALVLLVTGSALSVVTLRRAEHIPADPQAVATSSDAFLRRLYRLVLWVCCAYYYA